MPLLLLVLHTSIAVLPRVRKILARSAEASANPADPTETGLPTTPGHLDPAPAVPCARLIGKARWRARLRPHDARLDALVLQAGDRLDDLDETLLRCHPVRDAALFAEAARLHRGLERVQASISVARRKCRASCASVETPAIPEACRGARPRGRQRPATSRTRTASVQVWRPYGEGIGPQPRAGATARSVRDDR